MDRPGVVGLPVEEARLRLARQGFGDVTEIVTAPPRRPLANGEWRVVRQRLVDGDVKLVTALFPILARATAETTCD
jgi:hypothetical protein